VLSAFTGSEQVTITLPDTSPVCFNTSSPLLRYSLPGAQASALIETLRL
jgi:hypothetical protein